MDPTPNFEGFAEAMQRHRQNFGHTITFYVKGLRTYPPGTGLDDDGQPFDPTIEPITDGSSEFTVENVNAVTRPMGLSQRGIDADVTKRAIGWLEEGGVVLILDYGERAAVEDAERFDFQGEQYMVRQTDKDTLGPVERFLVWGAQA